MEWKTFEKYTPVTKENRDYVRKLADYCQSSGHRPAFHLTPPCGLMNDPNGLAYYEGNYHIFYQWYPFEASHGMKHWGHFISKDLASFEPSREILIPTEEYEKNGCYSGNSIQIGEKLFLYYTANYKTPDGKVPKQALALMTPDGKIEKYKNNPIIDEKPEGLTGEIRDPFVFLRNGKYYMLLGGGTVEGQGRILLYQSPDGLDWDYKGTISLGELELGYMFECPGLVKVGDKDVLFLSLMGMKPEGDRYQNEFTSIYLIGQLDVENLSFRVESYGELDKGFDFYAPQPFYDEKKEPIFYAWFGCGVQTLPYMNEDMWVHGLTMPRRLSIQEGKLIQSLDQSTANQYEIITLEKGWAAPAKKTFHLQVNPIKDDIRCIHIGEERDCFKIVIDKEKGHLTVDRSSLKQRFCQEYGELRSLSFPAEKSLKLDLYYDNTFAELFVNDGEEVMTFRAYPSALNIYAD